MLVESVAAAAFVGDESRVLVACLRHDYEIDAFAARRAPNAAARPRFCRRADPWGCARRSVRSTGSTAFLRCCVSRIAKFCAADANWHKLTMFFMRHAGAKP